MDLLVRPKRLYNDTVEVGMIEIKIIRHHMLQDLNPRTGDVMAVEHGWVAAFAIIPHRTVSGTWIWGRAYCRRVWVYTGFVDEPQTQWGTLFDVLANQMP